MTTTTTRAEAATALRQVATWLEQDDTAELEGEITLVRTVLPTSKEIERWAAVPEAYPEPAPRTTRFTLSGRKEQAWPATQ